MKCRSLALRATAFTLSGFVLAAGQACRRAAVRSDVRAPVSSQEETAKPPAKSWLAGTTDGKLRQIETQLRGFDKTMVEVGYRFSELYFSGKDRHWAYARYQIEKAIRLGLERRPKRAASAKPFMIEDLPAMLRAVEREDDKAFLAGMERLRASCMRRHVSEKAPHFAVEFPEHRTSPIRKTK